MYINRRTFICDRGKSFFGGDQISDKDFHELSFMDQQNFMKVDESKPAHNGFDENGFPSHITNAGQSKTI